MLREAIEEHNHVIPDLSQTGAAGEIFLPNSRGYKRIRFSVHTIALPHRRRAASDESLIPPTDDETEEG